MILVTMRPLLASLCLLSACSFFIDKAPATDPGKRPVPCTVSMVPPIADAVVGGGLVVIGLASIAAKDDSTSTATFVVAEVAVYGIAAVLGYSAYRGYTSVKRCRAYNAQDAPPQSGT
jgi:hypothetical protein